MVEATRKLPFARYSMTSSARTRIAGGIVRPSTFAVLRLKTSSNPIDGSNATHANGGTIGFHMKDAAQAEAWHKAGAANGGTSIEDPPSVRANGAYLAYLRDPDGNKLVGVARPAT